MSGKIVKCILTLPRDCPSKTTPGNISLSIVTRQTQPIYLHITFTLCFAILNLWPPKRKTVQGYGEEWLDLVNHWMKSQNSKRTRRPYVWPLWRPVDFIWFHRLHSVIVVGRHPCDVFSWFFHQKSLRILTLFLTFFARIIYISLLHISEIL